jgi:hypothetical protein
MPRRAFAPKSLAPRSRSLTMIVRTRELVPDVLFTDMHLHPLSLRRAQALRA